MTQPMATVRDEWRRYGYLPVVAALANVATVIHIYTLGPFMAPLEAEFGWSRAQISSAITVSNGINAGLGVLVGFLIDKYGPRRIGLIGICVMSLAFASVSTATGSYANWIFLWFLISLGAAWTQPTDHERLTLQTSQGYNRNWGELIVVAKPIG